MITRLEIVRSTEDIAFLNFWENEHGNDVCCQFGKDGKLIDYGGDGKEITFADFIARVKSIVDPFHE